MDYSFPHYFSTEDAAKAMAMRIIRDDQKKNGGDSEYKIVVMQCNDKNQPNNKYCIFDVSEYTSVSKYAKQRGFISVMFFSAKHHMIGKSSNYNNIKKYL